MTLLMTCSKCGAEFERDPGPGRPRSYCGDLCKRLVEYEIRRIDRRLGAYEVEQRELKADGPDEFDDEDRQKRLRALRKWIRQDEDRLRVLVGAGQNNQSEAAERSA